jgi:hypothetical protein
MRAPRTWERPRLAQRMQSLVRAMKNVSLRSSALPRGPVASASGSVLVLALSLTLALPTAGCSGHTGAGGPRSAANEHATAGDGAASTTPAGSAGLTSANVGSGAARVAAPAERHVVAARRRLPLDTDDGDIAAGQVSAAQWRARYPYAATELAGWAAQHPALLEALAAWEKRDPEKPSVVVEWAVTHVYEDIGGFLMQRLGWDDFRELREADPQGIDEFLAWVRRAPKAAEELVMRSRGFAAAAEVRPLGRKAAAPR